MANTTEASSGDLEVAARLASLCVDVSEFLAGVKKSIDEEIGAYPKPIPRCDAQFNFLYEQRSRLADTVTRMNAMSADAGVPSGLVARLGEFVAATPFTNDAREAILRERVRFELATLSPG